MRNFAGFVAYALLGGILIGSVPAALLAQEQPKHSKHDTLGYNEEVVKKLLEASDPDVAFLARVKMMQGHLNAAAYAVSIRDFSEARQHITHPASEILPDIVKVLQTRNLEDPTPALNAILDLLQKGTIGEIESALYDAIVAIALLEHSIDPSKMVMDRIIADTIALLLRTAVMEYDEAFEDGKIANIVEYHDGAAFVIEAAGLILDVKYQWSTQDPVAFHQLELSLRALQKAWPSEVPPAYLVIPVNEMLEYVTNIEVLVSTIRADF